LNSSAPAPASAPTPLPLRPLGTADLQVLRAHFEPRVQAWARAWLAQPVVALALGSAASGEAADAPDGVPDADGMEALGRRCVAGGLQVPAADLPLRVWQAVGQAAWQALRTALLPGADEGTVPAARAATGLRLVLDIDGLALAWHLPRRSWVQALPPVRTADPKAGRLGRYSLPARVARQRHALSVATAGFELPVADLMALARGDVLVLDQALDQAFQVRVQGLPDLHLSAHLGRRGNALAIELLP